MKFGLTANLEKPNVFETLRDIILFVSETTHDLIVDCNLHEPFCTYIETSGVSREACDYEVSPLRAMGNDIDVLLSVGGDGTILHAIRDHQVPILGINTGELGFLTEVTPKNAIKALKRIIEGEYTLDRRIRMKAVLNGVRLPDALNECVLHTAQVSKIRKYRLTIDHELVDIIRADAIIVGTPTGSTCYAMSAGGPIIDPRVPAFVIVPLAPFKLSSRPLVVPHDRVIEVRMEDIDRGGLLVIDGQSEHSINSKDILQFMASEDSATFIRFKPNFFKRVMEKLTV